MSPMPKSVRPIAIPIPAATKTTMAANNRRSAVVMSDAEPRIKSAGEKPGVARYGASVS